MLKKINMLKSNLGYDEKTTNLIVNKILNMKPINIPSIDNLNINDFKDWFVGFTDAEGSFTTTLRKDKNGNINRLTFTFIIVLNENDIEVLNFINKVLNNKNNVYIINRADGTKRVQFSISSMEEINNIVILLFNNKLKTKKYHDFIIWLNMIELYNNKNISFKDKYDDLLELRSKLNNYNYKHNDNDLNINMDINWYIGFMEGEGSYSVKYSNNKFALISEVSQRDESYKCFIAIKDLLYSLKPNINCKYDIKNKINIVEYPKTNKIKLTISSIDYFYWIYFPNIIRYNWNTRKSIDITLFMISNIILKHGLHYTDEGKELLFKIKNSMNKNRYNNIDIIPSIDEIMNVLSIKPIYDPNKTQDYNSRNIGRKFFIK